LATVTGEAFDPSTMPVTFRVNRTRTLLWFLVSVSFVAFGVLLLFTDLFSADFLFDSSGRLLGLVCVLFFGFTGIKTLIQLADRGIVVGVSPDGLYDSRIAKELIPWQVVEDLQVTTMKSHGMITARMVGFRVKHRPEFYLRTLKAESTMNRAAGFPPYNIGMVGLTGRFDELVGAIRRYRPN
jgi:hypothetical protein